METVTVHHRVRYEAATLQHLSFRFGAVRARLLLGEEPRRREPSQPEETARRHPPSQIGNQRFAHGWSMTLEVGIAVQICHCLAVSMPW